MRVLLSAACSVASVSAIKHLKSLGVKVIGIDSTSSRTEIGKNFCDEFYNVPLALTEEYLKVLKILLPKVNLFIPFIDEELINISNNINSFEDAVIKKIAMCNSATTLLCLDKVSFQKECEEVEIPIAPLAKKPPCIYKPRYGRGSRGVVIIDDYNQFDYYKQKNGVIQELMDGDEYTIDAIFESNNLIGHSCRKRVETSGVSTVGEIIQNTLIRDTITTIGKKLKLDGVVNIQGFLGKKDSFKIIEINPRVAGSATFSAHSGFDVYKYLILKAEGKLGEWKSKFKETKVIRFWDEFVI